LPIIYNLHLLEWQQQKILGMCAVMKLNSSMYLARLSLKLLHLEKHLTF
jgi:hypothetical protein